MNKYSQHYKRGFTIIELLIVIIVISILAVIVIVAYSGIQDRATFSREQDDLKTITKLLALYNVDNGNYPTTTGLPGCTYNWCGWNQVTGDSFIPGIIPKYANTIPQIPPNSNSSNTYLYQSNGTDYELIRYNSNGLTSAEMTNNPLLATGNGYDGIAWGYKTNSGSWW